MFHKGLFLVPILFKTYVAPNGRLMTNYSIDNHKYAEYTQLYTALAKRHRNNTRRIESCTTGLQQWFLENYILLNPDKSGFFFLRNETEVAKNAATTNCDSCRLPYHELETPCVTLDAALKFEDYVNHVAKTCNFHMWGLINRTGGFFI